MNSLNQASRLISFVKALSWRLLGTMTSWTIAYTLTKNPTVSTTFSLLDALIKIFLYYGHERFWSLILKIVKFRETYST